MKFRGFVAIDITATSKFSEFSNALRETRADLRLVELKNIHLTLKFLGDTDEKLVPEITDIIRTAAKTLRPLRFRFHGTGAFPNLNRINVVWIGVLNAEPMENVALLLDEKFATLGIAREQKPWSPHITVARVKSRHNIDRLQALLKQYRNEEFGEQVVDTIKLKKSVLTPKGPEYTTVSEIKFGE